MNVHPSFASVQKSFQSSAEKFTPEALQEAFQPILGNVKAWSELVEQQVQASQGVVAEAVEAFKSVKEPKAAFDAMSTFGQNLVALASKNIKDTVSLSVAQFKGSVASLEKSLPASAAVTSIANGMKDSATQMESTVEASVNESAAALKKARVA